MADEEHLKILRQGVAAWNAWREKHPESRHPDFREADLRRMKLTGANLCGAKLTGANLERAFLGEVTLEGANLTGANLIAANLTAAILHLADLRQTRLIETDLCGATLTESFVYGASAWNVKVDERTKQQNLVITSSFEPLITVDNLEVAQFIYLLLNNRAIRKVIDTITSKAVLVLGRFSEERKRVLDAVRDELRKRNYLPIVFDFQPSAMRFTRHLLNRPPNHSF
jgi:hypothetical protein